MATKVKHIQIDNTPTTWEPNAIYFVRNTGQVWQTDENGVPVIYTKNVATLNFGGNFIINKDGKFTFYHTTYGYNYVTMSTLSASSPEYAIKHPYIVGQYIHESGMRLKKIIISARYAYKYGAADIIIGRKKLLNGGGSTTPTNNAEIITIEPLIYQHQTQVYLEIDVNTNVLTQENDMIVWTIQGESGVSNNGAMYAGNIFLIFEK